MPNTCPIGMIAATLLVGLYREDAAMTINTIHDDETTWRAEQAAVDAQLAHIPLPGGATTDGWLSTRADGKGAIRSLTWSTHATGSRVGVEVAGAQDDTGAFERSVMIYANSEELTADEARRLAGALIEAADELDRLNR